MEDRQVDFISKPNHVGSLPLTEPRIKSLQERRLGFICQMSAIVILVSLLGGTLFFLVLRYQHKFTGWLACLIGGFIAAGMLTLMALLQSARCIVALLLPSLSTKFGKSLLVVILMSMLLTGPTTNFAYNLKQTTESLSCYAEAAVNQTNLTKRHNQRSTDGIRRDSQKHVDHFVNVINTVEYAIIIFNDSVKKAKDSILSPVEHLGSKLDQCRRVVRSFGDNCQEKLRNTKCECKKTIKIPFLTNIICDHLINTDLCVFTGLAEDICGRISDGITQVKANPTPKLNSDNYELTHAFDTVDRNESV